MARHKKNQDNGTQDAGGGPAVAAGPPETKADKFRRLARARMPLTLKRIRSIGNLANSATYEYTPDQSTKVIAALKDAVMGVISAFEGNGKEPAEFDV